MMNQSLVVLMIAMASGCGSGATEEELPSAEEARYESLASEAGGGDTKADLASDRLGALAPLSLAELDARYTAAETPTLEELVGPMQGRFLATPALSGPAEAVSRWLSSAPSLWLGKTFLPAQGDRGRGFNRFWAPGDALRIARFETAIGRSRAGTFDAVYLDYDTALNSPVSRLLLRAIRDEMRRVEPGVYLGRAYLSFGFGQEVFLFYFGLSR